MKTNVEYRQKDFYINPGKKVVACRLTFDIDLTKIPIYNKLLANDSNFLLTLFDWAESHTNSWTYEITENDILRVRISRTAKCGDADTFDEVFGKHLALTRTQCEAFVIATQLYDMMYNYVEDVWLADVNKLSDGSFHSFTKCEEHINKLVSFTK